MTENIESIYLKYRNKIDEYKNIHIENRIILASQHNINEVMLEEMKDVDICELYGKLDLLNYLMLLPENTRPNIILPKVIEHYNMLISKLEEEIEKKKLINTKTNKSLLFFTNLFNKTDNLESLYTTLTTYNTLLAKYNTGNSKNLSIVYEEVSDKISKLEYTRITNALISNHSMYQNLINFSSTYKNFFNKDNEEIENQKKEIKKMRIKKKRMKKKILQNT